MMEVICITALMLIDVIIIVSIYNIFKIMSKICDKITSIELYEDALFTNIKNNHALIENICYKMGEENAEDNKKS